MKRLLVITQVMDINDPVLGFFHEWVKEMSTHCESIEVICLCRGDVKLPSNVRVRSLGKEENTSKVQRAINFYRYVTSPICTKKIDGIFVHMNQIYVLLLIPFLPIRLARAIPLVWWKAHGNLNLFARTMVPFVDAVATSSESGFNINTPKRKIIGQGIDTSFFSPSDRGQKKDTHIVSVGRISKVKRYEDLVHALAQLNKKGYTITASIIGPEYGDKEYVSYLRKIIADNKLQDIVKLVGPKNQIELLKEYQTATILVNSSDTGSLDKVVLEAMSCGLVPVTSNPAYREMLAPYGLYLEQKGHEPLSQKLVEVISYTEDEQQKLSNALRSLVMHDHSLKKLARSILSLYE